MKKNVDFISLDSSLAQWLSEQLRTCVPRTPAAEELREALGDCLFDPLHPAVYGVGNQPEKGICTALWRTAVRNGGAFYEMEHDLEQPVRSHFFFGN